MSRWLVTAIPSWLLLAGLIVLICGAAVLIQGIDYFHNPQTRSFVISLGPDEAALVASLLGLLCVGVGGLVGLVLGIVARRQIAASGGRQTGDGVALTAVIIGAFIIVVWVAYWVAIALTDLRSPWGYL